MEVLSYKERINLSKEKGRECFYGRSISRILRP
jgi:hypothetical protein